MNPPDFATCVKHLLGGLAHSSYLLMFIRGGGGEGGRGGGFGGRVCGTVDGYHP